MMQPIEEFNSVSQKITQILENFPSESRTKILFDKWSLKDVIAHLNNWMVHDIDCLTALKENREPYWEPDVDEFNRKGTEERKGIVWGSLLTEFLTLKNTLLNIYKTLPNDLWDKPIWKDKHENARLFLEEDINHWKGEHLGVLKKKLEEVMTVRTS